MRSLCILDISDEQWIRSFNLELIFLAGPCDVVDSATPSLRRLFFEETIDGVELLCVSARVDASIDE